MRLPDFLVIGAMKAGTTSLCRDLEANPRIFFPTVKEPHTLVFDDVLTSEGKHRYAALFQKALPTQKCGEGSTGYTKLPFHQGVPARAKRLLGDDLRLIYIVREPISRAISQHYHMYRAGDAPLDFGDAVRSIRMIVDCGRYAMQLEPWLDAFGRENISVVKFEDYIQDRSRTISSLYTFLDVDPIPLGSDTTTVHNAGEEQLLPPRSLRDVTRRVTRSQWYKRNIHPRTPQWVRDRIKSIFYNKAGERPKMPTVDAVDFLIERFQDDVEKLRVLLGEQDVLWELDKIRTHYENIAAEVG